MILLQYFLKNKKAYVVLTVEIIWTVFVHPGLLCTSRGLWPSAVMKERE